MLSRIFVVFCTLLLVTALLGGCASGGDNSGYKKHAESRVVPKKISGSYRVRKGDSLYSISWRAGLDYQTVARWNGLRRPYTIYPGQLIKLYSPKKNTGKPHGKKSGSDKKTAPKVATHPSKPSGKPLKKRTKPVKKASVPKKKKSPALGKLHWQWPTKGRLLAKYSSRDAAHSGIKIGGRKGQKVFAAESGEVVYVGSGLIGYGQLIIIKHNKKYLSAYGHNSDLLVKEGDRVKKGQNISNMGVTNQGKALLYFEVRRYGKPVNPLAYLPGK
jgi:lipoprotein NlpD